MQQEKLHTYKQRSPYDSPHPALQSLVLIVWQFVWFAFCIWTPKPFNGLRLFFLRMFGAKLKGVPFVHSRARIEIPWNLTMHDRSCLGDRAHAYSLGEIELESGATIAQEAYLCTGTHKFDDPNIPLQTGKITVGRDAFVGARAFVMPGVTIGPGSVIGACSVVTSDMPDWTYCYGNPCQAIKPRIINRPASDV